MSLHSFDPGVFAVCQATLSFSLSGSSQLWFGSVTQQLCSVCVCVCVCVCVSSQFFICHMVKTWLWLLLNQNASRGLQCQPLWSSWSGVISLFGRFKSSCSIISAPIAAHISLITNKMFIRNLSVWTIAHALQELPFSSLPVSSCFLSALSLILSVWSTSWFPRHVQINGVETLQCYTPGCHTEGKARPGNPFRGIWMIRRSWPGWEWRHCLTKTTRCGVRVDDSGVSKLQITHMPSNLIK